MGVANFIVFDNDEPGFETFVNGKAIALAANELDAIASRVGLQSPSVRPPSEPEA